MARFVELNPGCNNVDKITLILVTQLKPRLPYTIVY